MLSTWVSCLEVYFPPSLLWVHPSFTPSLLLLQISLTEGYVSAEAADTPLHITPKKQKHFSLKSREGGSGPSPSVGLLAPQDPLHPQSCCSRNGNSEGPGEPKVSSPSQKPS